MAVSAPDLRVPGVAVFLHDFADVDCPQPIISKRLSAGTGWLGTLASAAGRDTESQLVRVGPPGLGEWMSREVRVRLARSTTPDASVIVPLRWEDARHPALFPVLDGNLEVVSLGSERCRILLYASYRPPFEPLGKVLDQAFLHRIAESTVRSFLHRVAAALEAGPSAVTEESATEGG